MFRAHGLLFVFVVAGLLTVVHGGSETQVGGGAAAATPTDPAFADDLLPFDDRVRYQQRIEEVYWRHRIWPAENPNPKPALEAVLSGNLLRERVESYLAKSVALEQIWSRPVTGEQLQAEMNRMVRGTKDPELLRELFAALDDDPFLVAECLARPVLVDRLARNWYTSDARFHGALRKQAETALAVHPNDRSRMPDLGGEYVETEVRLATVKWEKRPFVEWWTEQGLAMIDSTRIANLPLAPSGGYRLQSPLDVGCVVDTWAATSYSPAARSYQAAVWTGAEMIVWGGFDGSAYLHTGGRYDPATDSWTATSTASLALMARTYPEAVWTGTEMIVWGGYNGAYLNTGGRYNPTTDTWSGTSVGPGVPTERASASLIWTGTEMIVWGGGRWNGFWERFNTGGRYDPTTNSWTATSTGDGVPAGRVGHSTVWTGTEMIVWGGYDDDAYLDTGGRYDPTTDTWTATSTAVGTGVPTGRYLQTAVWTGTEMVVWGGYDGDDHVDTGGRYDPATNTWSVTATGPDVPTARLHHKAVWSGTEMIVWGGYDDVDYLNTGGRYDPTADSWSAVSTGPGVPLGRRFHTAVWTGAEMIVWGGLRNDGSWQQLNTGARYDPATDSWVPTSRSDGVPEPRRGHTAIWTGTEMIVWGGTEDDPVNIVNYLDTGGRYNLATDNWTPTGVGSGLPAGRDYHAAVWTGTEMIVWGGRGPDDDNGWPVYWDSGGRYDPASDSWTATSTGPAVPTARFGHTAIWTGTEMIVWGGGNNGETNTGGRYDPAEDLWTPTSSGTEAPTARTGHQAVWTGTEMIVWGGLWGPAQGLYTGGRYDPRTDSWTATSNWLSARLGPTAVWTGTEMVVWGGLRTTVPQYYDNGGRYSPATDTWIATSTTDGAPDGRAGHTGVWTGTEMIVWGGFDPQYVETGGRYDPAANGWTGMSTGEGAPTARSSHTAVWTGSAMIVWGGYDGGSLNSGGIYCACEGDAVNTWYPDADGDGFGSDSTGIPSCSQPAGYIAAGGDCDDTNADIYAGAPEINDGLDNQCPGEVGHGLTDEITGGCGFHDPDDKDQLSWSAQAGAISYEVARSTDPRFGVDCLVHVTTETFWDDGTPVLADACFHYLVRSTHPSVGSWGADSDGVERAGVCP